MHQDIIELIAEARRELRRASGLPLSTEEQAEENQRREMDEMSTFIFDKFRVRRLAPFKATTVWAGHGAAAEFSTPGKKFLLRKTGHVFRLSAMEGDGEREVAAIEPSDPQFVNKVLVAIGDNSGV